MTCPMCGGVSHPASGCAYTPTFVVCGPCVRDFWAWLIPFVNGKGRRKGLAFYDYARPVEPPKKNAPRRG